MKCNIISCTSTWSGLFNQTANLFHRWMGDCWLLGNSRMFLWHANGMGDAGFYGQLWAAGEIPGEQCSNLVSQQLEQIRKHLHHWKLHLVSDVSARVCCLFFTDLQYYFLPSIRQGYPSQYCPFPQTSTHGGVEVKDTYHSDIIWERSVSRLPDGEIKPSQL